MEHQYQIILADPPWPSEWGKGKRGGHVAPEKHYEPSIPPGRVQRWKARTATNRNQSNRRLEPILLGL